MSVHTTGTESTKISMSKRTMEVVGAALGWGRPKRQPNTMRELWILGEKQTFSKGYLGANWGNLNVDHMSDTVTKLMLMFLGNTVSHEYVTGCPCPWEIYAEVFKGEVS